MMYDDPGGMTHPEAPQPQVSIVIPSHNYARFLPGCLGSIARQRMNLGRVEVLLVDDASSDGSPELARELLAAMPLAASRVLVLPHTGRPGPVRNAGLRLARGQALLTLDPDDELLPDFLPRCLEVLATGADVAYTDYFLEEADGRHEVRLPVYHKFLLANQNILPCTALFKRRLWDLGVRFRSETGYEDWDFWVQLALKRARFGHVAMPLFSYRMHGGNYSVHARSDDARSKARIVADNAAFFPSWTQAWAQGVLAGEAGANPMERGIIPILPEHAARSRLVSAGWGLAGGA